MLIGAFPDLRFTTELMVADNDLVSAFTKVSGTHQGEFMSIPATGRPFLVNNADFCRFTDDGLICEHWGSSTPPRSCTNSASPARTWPGNPGTGAAGWLSVPWSATCMIQPVAQTQMCLASRDGSSTSPLHPRSALVTAVRSSSPTLPTASNLAV